MKRDRSFQRLLLVCWCLVLCGLSIPVQPAAASEPSVIEIKVKSSPAAPFSSSLHMSGTEQLIEKILDSPRRSIDRMPEIPLAYIKVESAGREHMFVLAYSLKLFDINQKQLLELTPEVQQELKEHVQFVSAKHYGKETAWQDIRSVFSRYDKARVIDLETGKSFMIQRRAGSHHADVQPLTAQDTAIMKQVYGGKWSWKRRAILLHVEGKYIAASMHGMPHGAGAISYNRFPGHFCIHFAGSATHKRSEPDPGHHLMIMKAAGKLNQQIYEASPYELVEMYVTALNEQDDNVMQMMINRTNPKMMKQWERGIEPIAGIKIKKKLYEKNLVIPEGELTDLMYLSVPVELEWYDEDDNKFHKRVNVMVKRDFLFNRWKVMPGSLAPLWED